MEKTHYVLMKKSEATYAQELFAIFESKDGFDRNRAEYQSVSNPEIAKLLTSKSGSGRGKPELTYRLGPNDLLVWEIKQEKAEDGIIHYMNGLKRAFNVLGVAKAA